MQLRQQPVGAVKVQRTELLTPEDIEALLHVCHNPRDKALISILWDLPSQTLYCNASATSAEKLMEIFERTFGLALLPISAGSLALRWSIFEAGKDSSQDQAASFELASD